MECSQVMNTYLTNKNKTRSIPRTEGKNKENLRILLAAFIYIKAIIYMLIISKPEKICQKLTSLLGEWGQGRELRSFPFSQN